jgi:predicted CoA-substrate-specific enzyme activase
MAFAAQRFCRHSGRVDVENCFVGIDCGSVSLNAVVIDGTGKLLYEAPYVRHLGHVDEKIRALLLDLAGRFGPDSVQAVAFTGIHGRRLGEVLDAPYEVETVAQILGAVHVEPKVRTIISVGGQDTALFQLAAGNGSWNLESFAMNGPCASGTGSFIDQQAERLASSLYGRQVRPDQEQLQSILDDFIKLGLTSETPAPVACRCTVFTKSDMIHLQNKGEPLANIIAGLHCGNAANYVSTIVGNRTLTAPQLLVGGMASNPLQVQAFRTYYPELQVPPHHTSLGALGAALQAAERGWRNRPDADRLDGGANGSGEASIPRAGLLKLNLTSFDSDNSLLPLNVSGDETVTVWLGMDVGSTTTKYALIDMEGTLVHKSYVQTRGKPIEVTRSLLTAMQGEVGERVSLAGISTTGSGRQVVGDFLGADLIIDEITAHARGAAEVDPHIDTIFEIGGQDSKYIRLENGLPLDFDMNKVCAAGTGSFLHELANKMDINIVGEFQETALAAPAPVNLAERCTVFMETDIVSYLQKGARRDDLIAGLSYATVHNYLNRVVGKRSVGRNVMFLGGPSLNKAIVAAFENILGRPVAVPKHREVMGAYGAALAGLEARERGEIEVASHRLGELAGREVDFREKTCRVDRSCHNECKLKIYDFGGKKSIWGGDCGRYEVGRRGGARGVNFFKERQESFMEALQEGASFLGRDGELPERDGKAPTIGLPLSLHSLEWGIFWARALSDLGWGVVLSRPTDNATAQKGLEAMTAETCFPVKVFHGHVHALQEKTDALFLPNVINMPTPHPREGGLFCPYIEGSQYMVKAALEIPEERILRPSLRLKEGPEGIVEDFSRCLPQRMRPGLRALEKILGTAWEKKQEFSRLLRSRGEAFLRETAPGNPVWVITGRPYNLHDERCNLQLGRHLSMLGISALPMDYLDLGTEDLSDFPKMYWGLGSRILRAGRRIARSGNLYGVHISNFGCGPDSFIEHFYRHVMGDKPSLMLELDEHSAVAGMLTRLEAFRNVVKNTHRKKGVHPAAPSRKLSPSRTGGAA